MLRFLALAAAAWFACEFSQAQPEQRTRGEHLAKHVAMCVQCHSPRDQSGELIDDELFLGAPIPLESMPRDWATRAPRIARLPGGWSEQDLIHFLQTGVRPDGTSAKRPMPPFRMNRQEAAAITAFLKSVDTTKGH